MDKPLIDIFSSCETVMIARASRENCPFLLELASREDNGMMPLNSPVHWSIGAILIFEATLFVERVVEDFLFNMGRYVVHGLIGLATRPVSSSSMSRINRSIELATNSEYMGGKVG